jgi:halogenation protein CepH
MVSKQGHQVLLLERERFPRYQIGESLLPATIHGICHILGVADEIENAGFVRKNGAAFRWGSSDEPWVFGFSQARMLDELGANYAYQVERSKFDSILLKNARRCGVDVRESNRVFDLIVGRDRVIGVRYTDDNGREHEARALFVADASGHSGQTYRHAGRRVYSRFFQNLALFGYFAGGQRLPPPNEGNILCEAFELGWIWYIPLSHAQPSLTSVGAVVGREHAAKIRNGPEIAMREFIEACPKVRGLLKGSRRITHGQYGRFRIRKDWSYTNERFWTPGLLLVGDAACFIDPVLSSGVHLATYSALLAARTINTCLRQGYDDVCVFDEFERRYRLEYATFYNYLVAFYDMHRDEKSYYWEARKVLGTAEEANQAFIRLVAGGATAAEIFFQGKRGIGAKLQSFARDLQIDRSMDHRIMVTRQMAEDLHRFDLSATGQAPVHSGSEDIRTMSWGRTERAAVVAMSQSCNNLVPSPDGLHWAVEKAPN